VFSMRPCHYLDCVFAVVGALSLCRLHFFRGLCGLRFLILIAMKPSTLAFFAVVFMDYLDFVFATRRCVATIGTVFFWLFIVLHATGWRFPAVAVLTISTVDRVLKLHLKI
jgi:hypothetical protein